ncbi:MAG: zinc-ribbon domain-containing protein [Deltaproteobacteria bacterium]|nr:zinc-ribbon domain-containing protein [Deltaproteobacteria bacterium]MBW2265492.1 zinc-ribbon domain-containing protein [Deltaproteobacteria bacterium]MBW2601363.1 zinc-ribbon domain-containing protein [Deltaproteobacteria bacterium]
MLITCESCKSKFKLDDSLIKDSGSKVKCSNCQHVFTAYKSSPAEDISPDLDLGEGPSDQFAEEDEESLDFDLFESEGQQEEEDPSLEDFGFEDELGIDAEQTIAEETVIAEEEISAADLGFDEDVTEEGVSEPEDEPVSDELTEEDISLEGLSLEEEAVSEDALPGTEEETEEDISFEDLTLEDEGLGEEVQQAPEEEQEAEESEQDLSFEELSLEDDLPVEESVSKEQLVETAEEPEAPFPEDVPVASLEDGEETEEESQEQVPPVPPREEPVKKRRISVPLLIVLIIVLAGGGAYLGYQLFNSGNIKMPFLESLIGAEKSETIDPGNLHITLLEDTIKGEFDDSKAIGRVFVIKGNIKNDYPGMRNFIRMKGVLYLKDGKIAKDQTVYCANVLSDTELQTTSRQVVKKRLDNRFGDNKSNFRISPGKILPFMFVFHDIPQDLGEFSVEVVGSVPWEMK